MYEQPETKIITPATRQIRALHLAASVLVLIAGVQLFVLSEQTDRYFAWTISPPLSAAFLGAGYWSSLMLEGLAARRREWARVRIAVPTALTFTILILITTLLHLDRFHLGSTDVGAQVAAWVWLAVYAGGPPIFLLLLVRQLREPGEDPPGMMPITPPIRLVLSVQGGILALCGLALFLVPQVVGPLWPWSLTPLTGRAVGAWLLSMAVAAFHAHWEDDLDRILPASISYATFGALQLLALARYTTPIDWNKPGTYLYIFFCLTMVAVGVAAILAWRRRSLSATPPAIRS